jgi:hypothetical protein
LQRWAELSSPAVKVIALCFGVTLGSFNLGFVDVSESRGVVNKVCGAQRGVVTKRGMLRKVWMTKGAVSKERKGSSIS